MLEVDVHPQHSGDPQWFVLDGPHHQGPYHEGEVRELLEAGAYSVDLLLWRAGMADWLPLEDVIEFHKYAGFLGPTREPLWEELEKPLQPEVVPPQRKSEKAAEKQKDISATANNSRALAVFQAPLRDAAEIVIDAEALEVTRPEPVLEPKAQEVAWSEFVEKSGVHRKLEEHREIAARMAAGLPSAEELKARAEKSLEQVVTQAMHAVTNAAKQTADIAFRKKRWLEIGLASAAFASLLAAVGVTVVLPKMVKPQPSIGRFDDLLPEDRRGLELATTIPLQKGGARVALAVSQTDYFAPVIFVASNLPDGTVLNVQIDGIPESLVDRFKVSVKASVTLKDGIAKTPVFRQDDGSPYSMGQYRASVTCLSCAGSEKMSARVLARKAFFLGQEAVAGDYERALKAYHSRLKTAAEDELAELKQLAESLDNQLNETDLAFQAEFMRGLPVATRPDRWNSYHARWTGFQEQLDAVFARWTPEALDGGYFHASLFAALKKTGERTRAVHQAQYAYMTSGHRDPVARDKINRDTAEAKVQLQALQIKVQRTAELPLAASGMPQRLRD